MRINSGRKWVYAALLITPCSVSQAAEVNWVNAVGGTFNSPSNWSSGAVPGPNDTVVFDLPWQYAISMASNHTNAGLRSSNGFVTLDLNDNEYTLTSPGAPSFGAALSVTVAPGSVSRLHLADGHIVAESASVSGAFLDSDVWQARLIVLEDMVLETEGSFIIGNSGEVGHVQVARGATLTSDSLSVGFYGKGTLEFDWFGNGEGHWTTNVLAVGSQISSDGSLVLPFGSTITVNDSATFGNAKSATGSSVVNGGTLNAAIGLTVAYEGNGSLVVSHGGKVSSGLSDPAPFNLQVGTTIGHIAGSHGHAMVTGVGSVWDTNTLYVGRSGTGTLEITDRGMVNSKWTYIGAFDGSQGSAAVSGLGSHWNVVGDLAVGYWGTGSLDVLQGGRLVSTGLTLIGDDRGQGTVRVSGNASRWESEGNVYVGGWVFGQTSRSGELRIEIGATVDIAPTASLTVWTPGTITLSGGTLRTGSLNMQGGLFDWYSGLLDITGDSTFEIGAQGPFGEELELFAGRHLKVTSGEVAQGGRLTLLGGKLESTGTFTNSGTMRGIGRITASFVNGPAGHLIVDPFDRIEIDSRPTAVTNYGTIRLNEGTLDITGDLANYGLMMGRGAMQIGGGGNYGTFFNEGRAVFSGGTSDLVAAQIINLGEVLVAGGGTTTIDALVFNQGRFDTQVESHTVFLEDVVGDGTFTGLGTVTFYGSFNPENAAIQFGGDTIFAPGSRLDIEITGPTPGTQYDRLQVAGTAYLGGTLDVDFDDDFKVSAGQSFEVLTALGGLVGGFDSFEWDDLEPMGEAVTLALEYTHNSVFVNVVPLFLPGDFNLDGTVDARDYTVWRNTMGSTGAGLPADANGDLVVNQLDYVIWKDNYGLSTSTGGALAQAARPVPEPGLLALLLPLALGVMARRHSPGVGSRNAR